MEDPKDNRIESSNKTKAAYSKILKKKLPTNCRLGYKQKSRTGWKKK